MKAGDRNVYICARTYQESQSIAARLKMPSYVYVGSITMLVTRGTSELRGQVLVLAANWRSRSDCMDIIRVAQEKEMGIMVLDDLGTARVRRPDTPEPFTIGYTSIIKGQTPFIDGNGFSIDLDVDREEAERFATWLNVNMPHWSKLIPPSELIDPPTKG